MIRTLLISLLAAVGSISPAEGLAQAQQERSVARIWNDQLLWAIRLDTARPTVHARNLFHISAAMWDAWAAYHPQAKAVFHDEKLPADDIVAARHEAISYAAYRLLMWRFKNSPNAIQTESSAGRLMAEFGYDIKLTGTEGDTPAALGNRVAATVISHGLSDGSNEQDDYANRYYRPVNASLNPTSTGNPAITEPDRWQPLDIPDFVGQSGQREENYPPFVGPEWGNVIPFSLSDTDAEIRYRDGHPYRVYLDPGPPPSIEEDPSNADRYKAGFEQVVEWSSRLDPGDGIVIDISPAARGNNTLGTNDGSGHPVNPATGKPYRSQWVFAGDYYRVLAEFWADGPNSETPPGHWFWLLNYVIDGTAGKKRFRGEGPVMDDLEWDLRAYLALGGAMHDVAVAAWSLKGWYDFVRPVSAVRYMCERGQSSDPSLAGYHPHGVNLKPGVIELVTEESAAPGGRHRHLLGESGENLGKIAVRSWRGPDYVPDPDAVTAGVGWILCGDWWPYQRPNFVTPPFAGYVSGHSTYSRAAAEVLTLVTGSAYFPGGYAYFEIPQDEYLVFEKGPSKSFQLQWATYQDAADECSISRIYGGIHPPADDIPGRLLGHKIGHQAFDKAQDYFPPVQ